MALFGPFLWPPLFSCGFMLVLITGWLLLIVLIVLVIILWVPIVPVVHRLLLFVHCDLQCAVNGVFVASKRSLCCVRSPHCVNTVSSLCQTVSSLGQYGLFTASKLSLHCIHTVSSLRRNGLFAASKHSLRCIKTVSLLRQNGLFAASIRSLHFVETVFSLRVDSLVCASSLYCMCITAMLQRA
jgi:hypothetical protein